ncbi:2-dehydropantoate 2-reductase [Thiorhodococcus mannitoliphagus]|uniref:2-dehydropantoate 2-reductase n=1 Tax=Thiorhodococcus mannitoliphagus TaxID=329406 RepID=A0A6P1E0J5_9GAMM|nr:2-dehydropantoate 2-reductase [Thiorhodococcus mannitoliphagus]NEX23429.1 2-dehydropantoate 2-reductase [Thiorhodococcus mannitoliphagus]
MTSQTLSFTILGTGALGGFYGARLLHHGFQVRFIAHSDADYMRQHGLRVDSPLGDLHHFPVDVYRASDEIPQSDVVCVALKTTQNHQLVDLLRPLVRPGTVILNFQNGLTMEEALSEAFPDSPVVAGLCFLCSNKLGPGHIAHLDYGLVSFAPQDARGQAWVPRLMDAFASSGVKVERFPSLLKARWRKLAWNIPFNGLSVVLDANTDSIMRDPDARALAEQLMAEVALGAAACGAPFDAGFTAKLLEVTEAMTPYAPSMRLDYLAKRALEIEFMYDRPLREVAKLGVRLPAVEAIARQLHFLDRRNRQGDT